MEERIKKLLEHEALAIKRKLTAENIKLSPLFSSGMVIQTSPNTIINGYADPGTSLAVRISDYIKIVKADSSGKWQARFPEIVLRSPFSLFIEGSDTTIEMKNVLAGKVYVIAGDAFLDPISALNDNICQDMTVMPGQNIKVFKPLPSDIEFPCSEFSTGKWISAEMAMNSANSCKIINIIQQLPSEKHAAIGIIDLTWPGSTLESWMPGISVYDTILKKLTETNIRTILSTNDSIFTSIKYMIDTCTNGIEKGITKVWFDDEFWRNTSLPVNISKKIDFQKKRIVYLRKKIYISSKYLTSDFIISLGKVHGRAEFYFNEVKIKDNILKNGETQLNIPDTIMRVWANLLSIRLFCPDSLAGIYGTEFSCTNTDSTFRQSIYEKWKYKSGLEEDFPQHIEIEKCPSAMYNGMLSPILNQSFSSFIWYGAYNNISTSGNLETGICKLLKNTGCDNYYIAYDTSADSDTIVYGQRLKQLENKLIKTAKNCGAKGIITQKNQD